MNRNIYETPLASRYASAEMLYLFSPDKKFTTWHRLWVALARGEMELGLPVTQEQVDELVRGTWKSGRGKGSGIGFHNVQERIRLYFGQNYGMEVESEPDEGTRIRIYIPARTVGEMEQDGGGRRE